MRKKEYVLRSLEWSEQKYASYEIRDVYELLLYLPLIDETVLRDVVFRCLGNLEGPGRQYVKEQLSYLHRSISRIWNRATKTTKW